MAELTVEDLERLPANQRQLYDLVFALSLLIAEAYGRFLPDDETAAPEAAVALEQICAAGRRMGIRGYGAQLLTLVQGALASGDDPLSALVRAPAQGSGD